MLPRYLVIQSNKLMNPHDERWQSQVLLIPSQRVDDECENDTPKTYHVAFLAPREDAVASLHLTKQPLNVVAPLVSLAIIRS